MRFESLEYFLEIAKCGSFTHAAKRLYVSQQGLSKAIKALEKELGCRLFRRDGAQITLTAAGHALVPYAQACLDDAENLRRAMEAYGDMSSPGRAPIKERITLYATTFITDTLFSLFDDDLHKANMPSVRIIEQSYDQIIDELSGNPEPMLFALCLPVDRVSELCALPHVRFAPLFSAEILLLGSSQFIHPDKGSFDLFRIAKMPIVYYNDPTLNCLIDEMFEGIELENVITHASSISRITRYIQQGKAVSFTDSLSCFLGDAGESIAYAPIEGSPQFIAGFVYRDDVALPQRYLDYAEEFSELLKTRCASYFEMHPIPVLEI